MCSHCFQNQLYLLCSPVTSLTNVFRINSIYCAVPSLHSPMFSESTLFIVQSRHSTHQCFQNQLYLLCSPVTSLTNVFRINSIYCAVPSLHSPMFSESTLFIVQSRHSTHQCFQNQLYLLRSPVTPLTNVFRINSIYCAVPSLHSPMFSESTLFIVQSRHSTHQCFQNQLYLLCSPVTPLTNVFRINSIYCAVPSLHSPMFSESTLFIAQSRHSTHQCFQNQLYLLRSPVTPLTNVFRINSIYCAVPSLHSPMFSESTLFIAQSRHSTHQCFQNQLYLLCSPVTPLTNVFRINSNYCAVPSLHSPMFSESTLFIAQSRHSTHQCFQNQLYLLRSPVTPLTNVFRINSIYCAVPSLHSPMFSESTLFIAQSRHSTHQCFQNQLYLLRSPVTPLTNVFRINSIYCAVPSLHSPMFSESTLFIAQSRHSTHQCFQNQLYLLCSPVTPLTNVFRINSIYCAVPSLHSPMFSESTLFIAQSRHSTHQCFQNQLYLLRSPVTPLTNVFRINSIYCAVPSLHSPMIVVVVMAPLSPRPVLDTS